MANNSVMIPIKLLKTAGIKKNIAVRKSKIFFLIDSALFVCSENREKRVFARLTCRYFKRKIPATIKLSIKIATKSGAKCLKAYAVTNISAIKYTIKIDGKYLDNLCNHTVNI